MRNSEISTLDELSVFFPAYNEADHVGDTVNKAFRVLPKVAKKYEVLVIDDGSVDETGKILKKLKIQYSKLKTITHKPNRGYGEALKSGFYNCKYNWITFTDADGQFDFSEIVKLIDRQKETGADLVVGYYLKRAVSWRRKLNTWLWQLVVRLLFGLKVKDIDCGFKLIRKKVIEEIPELKSGRGAFISSEFLIKAKKSGFKIAEVGVHHYPRTAGHGTGANIDVIINSFIDLFKLWMELR